MLEAEEERPGILKVLQRECQKGWTWGGRSLRWKFYSVRDWSAVDGGLEERRGSFAPDVIARGSDQ